MRSRGESALDIKQAERPSTSAPSRRDSVARTSAAGPAPVSLHPPPSDPDAVASTLAAKYRIVSASPTETVATAGDCLLVIVQQTVSTIGVSAIQRAYEQLEAEYEQVGYFSYIEGSRCTPMDAQARKLMADVVRRHTSRTGIAAMVVAGDGFRCTVVRSILTGIHLASRADHPMRAFRAVEPALAWYQAKWPRRKHPPSALREALLALHPSAARALR
jgi:hypothetical protein